MATDAELAGAIEIDETPFVGSLRNAERAWRGFNSTLETGAKSGFAQIGNALNSVSGKLQSIGGSLTGVGASMVAGISAPIAYAVKSASDLSEALNKSNQVFGTASASIQAFASTAAASLGLSQKAALDAAGGFGNLFSQLGVSSEKAAQMSTAIVTLAADFASFHNADISEVLNAQSAAFRGEYDSLQRFLPLISAATVEQEAMAMSGKKNTKELTAQEKALAVNALMFKGAGAAVGDFARTSDGMANVMRIVKAQLENVATEFGAAFLPRVQEALVVVRQMMTAFSELSPGVKKIITDIALFGAVLAPVVLSLGLVATALGTLISPVGLVVAAVAGLGVAFATNFGGIRDVVMKWVEEAKTFYLNHQADIEALGVKVKEIFGNYIQELSKAATELITTLNQMKTAIDGFSSSNDGSWKAILFAAKYAVESINVQLKAMIFAFSNAVTAVKGAWAGLEEIIINPIKNALNWIKSNAAAFEAAFSAITYAARVGLVVKSPPLAAKWVMMIGDAAEDNAKRVKASSKDYQAGFEAITSALGLSNEALRILLKYAPESAKELFAQKQVAVQTSATIDAYSAAVQTASGRNSDLVRKVDTAIASLLLFDEQARQTIKPINSLVGAIGEVTIVSKEMGEAIAKSVGSLASATIGVGSLENLLSKMKSSQAALAEWGKVMSDGVRKLKDEIQSNLGDGVGGALIELSKKFGWSLNKVNDWSSGMLDIIGGIPGKIGDKLRGATSKFLDFVNGVDRVFKGLHKIFDQVPDGIAGMLSKVVGLFKNASSGVGGGGIFGAIGGFFGKIFGGGGGTGAAGTGISEGMASNASKGGGILSGLGGALGIAGIGASLLPAIIGLFKGKSQIQKDTEKAQLDQLKANVAKTYEDIKGAMVETMQKGAALLESLKGFVEVPRKAITRFVNQLGLVLELFLEESKRLAAKGIEQGKAVVDNLGGAFEFMLGGAELINAIKGIASITEQNISDFISTTFKIIEKWTEAASAIEMQSAKFTGKISDKLRTSFEFLGIVPDVIKGFAESVSLDDSKLDSAFSTAQKIVQKMKELSEAERGLELNKAGASASIFATIFETLKGMMDAFTSLSSYKPLEDTILNKISSDLQKLIDWGSSLTALADKGTLQFDTLQASLSKFGSSIRTAVGGLSGLQPAGSGITASIVRQDGAQFASRQGGAAAAPTIVTQHNTFQISMSLRDLEELAAAPDKIARIERLLNDMRSKTGQTAQSQAGY